MCIRDRLSGIRGITFPKDHDGVAADAHGIQLGLFIQRFFIVEKVQIRQRFFDVILIVQVTLLVYLDAVSYTHLAKHQKNSFIRQPLHA